MYVCTLSYMYGHTFIEICEFVFALALAWRWPTSIASFVFGFGFNILPSCCTASTIFAALQSEGIFGAVTRTAHALL